MTLSIVNLIYSLPQWDNATFSQIGFLRLPIPQYRSVLGRNTKLSKAGDGLQRSPRPLIFLGGASAMDPVGRESLIRRNKLCC